MQLLCKGNIFNAVGSLYGCCEVCMCSINVGEVECITPSDDVFTGYIGIVGDEQVLQLFKGVSRKLFVEKLYARACAESVGTGLKECKKVCLGLHTACRLYFYIRCNIGLHKLYILQRCATGAKSG